MAKFNLTISADYCSSWGIWEGVRELVQNAADANDNGHEMSVRFSPNRDDSETGTLRIANEGVKLDLSVWLMGTSSKADGNSRGHFGEGLKLGVLALVRKGLDVKIVNDDESWTPTLEESETFAGSRVLTVTTRKRESTGKFVIEVPFAREAWESIKPRFLFLAKPKRMKETPSADVILDENYKGSVYVKGIFVEHNPKLEAGYNLKRVSVDRDRRMVNRYEAEDAMAQAWAVVATQSPATVRSYLVPMLEKGAADIADLRYRIGDETRKALVEGFVEKYGPTALAVRTVADAREAEHYGRRGVVQPDAFVAILEQELKTVEQLRRELADATTRLYSWSEFSDEEQTTWAKVMLLVEAAAKVTGYDPVESRTTIVDFRDANLSGTYSNGDGAIKIAKRLLSNRRELVRVLVHEVAHGAGSDGEKAHEVAEGRLFGEIINSLMA